MSSPITDGTAKDVLAILGASSPTDVRIKISLGVRPAYAFEAALWNAPDYVLPIDAVTASALIASGARRA